MTNPDSTFLQNLVAHIVTVARAHGDKAPSERELAEHFNVSRGQVRESLAILEAMKVIERRAKSGIYLTPDVAGPESMALFAQAGVPLTARHIAEVVELRKIHEIKAAELAALRATDEDSSGCAIFWRNPRCRLPMARGCMGWIWRFTLKSSGRHRTICSIGPAATFTPPANIACRCISPSQSAM
jgi:DNA-binding transcriptional regulator YhcF (GntR family)